MRNAELFEQRMADVIRVVDEIVASDDSPVVQDFLATRQTIVDGYNWLDPAQDQVTYLLDQSGSVDEALRPIVVSFATACYDKLKSRNLLEAITLLSPVGAVASLVASLVKSVDRFLEQRKSSDDESVNQSAEEALSAEIIDAIIEADYDLSYHNIKTLVNQAQQIKNPVRLKEFAEKYTLPYVGDPFANSSLSDDSTREV